MLAVFNCLCARIISWILLAHFWSYNNFLTFFKGSSPTVARSPLNSEFIQRFFITFHVFPLPMNQPNKNNHCYLHFHTTDWHFFRVLDICQNWINFSQMCVKKCLFEITSISSRFINTQIVRINTSKLPTLKSLAL